MPMMPPAYLFRLDRLKLGLGCDSGMNILIRGRHPLVSAKSARRQRRSLRARGQRRGAGGNSNGKFQKVAAFHDFFLLVSGE